MIKLSKSRIDKLIVMGMDFLSLMLAFFLASVACLWSGLLVLPEPVSDWLSHTGLARLSHFMIIAIAALGVFWVRGHYTKRRPLADEWLDILKTIALCAGLELLVSFLLGWQFSRARFMLTWLFCLPILPASRYWIKRRLIALGRWSGNTLIIGVKQNALEAARALLSDPQCGFRVAAFMEPPADWEHQHESKEPLPDAFSLDGNRIPVIGALDDFGEWAAAHDIRHTVVALESTDVWQVNKLMFESNWDPKNLKISLKLQGLPLASAETLPFFSQDLFLLQVRNNLARKMPQRIKRLFDLVMATCLILALSPLFLACMLMIGRGRNPSIFGQQRVGMHGQIFTVYKFRTMVVDAEEQLTNILASDPKAKAEWEQYCKIDNDPRITRLGRFLRSSSIDELPQLWNVVKGDMSLVGPRPVKPLELERYGENKHYYMQVRPGISGIWQISGRSDTTYTKRVNLDTWYVRNWTLWYDIFILIRTIGVVIGRSGSR